MDERTPLCSGARTAWLVSLWPPPCKRGDTEDRELGQDVRRHEDRVPRIAHDASSNNLHRLPQSMRAKVVSGVMLTGEMPEVQSSKTS